MNRRMQRCFILYDCPLKSCDKLWLYEQLKLQFSDVKSVETLCCHSLTWIKYSYFGKLFVFYLILSQCIRVICQSNSKDIIITWSNLQGLILNQIVLLLHLQRKTISFNWIGIPTRKTMALSKKALNNRLFIPVINSPELKEQIVNKFNLSIWYGILLPDIYDSYDSFIVPKYKVDSRYCFTGGMNNRDWDTLIKIAEKLPNIKFICVALKKDWSIPQELLPSNITLYHDLPAREYYDLLKNAYLTIFPLKENKVSGLINIIKSFQYGVIALITKIPSTERYYPKEENLLLKFQDVNGIVEKIEEIYSFSKEEYERKAKCLQNYLINNFSPQKVVQDLIDNLQLKNWF